jgi:hypothetical protein
MGGNAVLNVLHNLIAPSPERNGQFVAEIRLERSLGAETVLWSQRFGTSARAATAARRKLRHFQSDLPHVQFVGAGKVKALTHKDAKHALKSAVRHATYQELVTFEAVDRKDLPLFI